MKIKTLFIIKEIPYPTIGGVCLRNWQNINIMKKYGDIAVFAIDNKDININTLPPVDLFYYHNLHQGNTDKSNNLSNLSTNYCKYAESNYNQEAYEILNSLMRDFQPDIVIIEQLWLYIYMEVIKNYPCKVILDNHNIEADLLANKGGNTVSDLDIKQVQEMEKQAIMTSNQVWLCSHNDQVLLQNNYGDFDHIYLVPNAINIDAYTFNQHNQQENNQANKIIFSGYFPYQPNQFAAELLIKEIFPSLQKKYPESCLLLVGYQPTEFMINSSNHHPQIIVTGEVADVKPYFSQANVMVVPLFHGGGTRLKILEAFASGCVVVSTSKGAEGLMVNDGEHLLLADNTSDIIDAVDKIWSDQALHHKLAQSAYSLVNSVYSWQAVANNIEYAIKQLFTI